MAKGLRCMHERNPFLNSYNQYDLLTKEKVITICKLTKTGLVLFNYLTNDAHLFRGQFVITYLDFSEKTKLRSKKSFYLGVDNLIRYGLIAKTEEAGFFYFNPNYFPYYGNSI